MTNLSPSVIPSAALQQLLPFGPFLAREDPATARRVTITLRHSERSKESLYDHKRFLGPRSLGMTNSLASVMLHAAQWSCSISPRLRHAARRAAPSQHLPFKWQVVILEH
ncbi:MAG: hypothetical protein Fur005_37890 [Roseiflexaceae bacterium]